MGVLSKALKFDPVSELSIEHKYSAASSTSKDWAHTKKAQEAELSVTDSFDWCCVQGNYFPEKNDWAPTISFVLILFPPCSSLQIQRANHGSCLLVGKFHRFANNKKPIHHWHAYKCVLTKSLIASRKLLGSLLLSNAKQKLQNFEFPKFSVARWANNTAEHETKKNRRGSTSQLKVDSNSGFSYGNEHNHTTKVWALGVLTYSESKARRGQ